MRAFFPSKMQSSGCLSSSVLLFWAQTSLSQTAFSDNQFLTQRGSQCIFQSPLSLATRTVSVLKRNFPVFHAIMMSVGLHILLDEVSQRHYSLILSYQVSCEYHFYFHTPIPSLCSLGLAFIVSHVRVLYIFSIL